MTTSGCPEGAIRLYCKRVCPSPGVEQVLCECMYYMYEKQWPVAEAGMSAVKVRQAEMALTTGSL